MFAKSGRVWIFDLDNTLHDARPHIFPRIHQAMTAYMQTHFGCDEAAAHALREQYWQNYGATLTGVLRHHNVDPQHFLQETHDIRALAPQVVREPGVRTMLTRLPGRKVVFSNAPLHYAIAVLEALGVADLFDEVFSIEHTNYRPKPDSYGFFKLLRKQHVRPESCVMIEDTLANLRTAKRLGMSTVWIAQAARIPAYVDFSIRSLLQLPRLARHWN